MTNDRRISDSLRRARSNPRCSRRGGPRPPWQQRRVDLLPAVLVVLCAAAMAVVLVLVPLW